MFAKCSNPTGQERQRHALARSTLTGDHYWLSELSLRQFPFNQLKQIVVERAGEVEAGSQSAPHRRPITTVQEGSKALVKGSPASHRWRKKHALVNRSGRGRDTVPLIPGNRYEATSDTYISDLDIPHPSGTTETYSLPGLRQD